MECSANKNHIPEEAEQLRPHEWELVPGEPGFNAYVQNMLRQANLPRLQRHWMHPISLCTKGMTCQGEYTDRLYQRVVSFLVHPSSPVRRLLVAHQLGTGKTITMLRILDRCNDGSIVAPRSTTFGRTNLTATRVHPRRNAKRPDPDLAFYCFQRKLRRRISTGSSQQNPIGTAIGCANIRTEKYGPRCPSGLLCLRQPPEEGQTVTPNHC